MKTQNVTQQASADKYFDSVLYARACINEVKTITPKKGDKYCAINASILSNGGDGKTVYTTIDLIVSGNPAKEILRTHWGKRPTDRMDHKGPRWTADINVGSIRVEPFSKKDGSIGAVLKGRLLNIRALQIGDEVVAGTMSNDCPEPILVAPGYINLLDPEKGKISFSMLDGKVEEPNSQYIGLDLKSEVPAINELIAHDLCPKGYQQRNTNPVIFATLEISELRADGYRSKKDGTAKAALKGILSGVRYLKADGNVLVGGKKNTGAAQAA
ncbi:DUF3577 domain-containing protein [Cardiobacterium hominis]|jgi:hypothetical protein|uniref:DUF3577 domain-containing protein n=1 Tax=Cardiobacterium hominis TaxID=2718 RepID=UPI0028E66D48|nr:DUF3577 domain-containing protein [Cardiobacterium hominis]